MYGGLVQGQVVEERSALLASRGFASLALAYFGLEGLPKNYLDLGKVTKVDFPFSLHYKRSILRIIFSPLFTLSVRQNRSKFRHKKVLKLGSSLLIN